MSPHVELYDIAHGGLSSVLVCCVKYVAIVLCGVAQM